MLHDPRLMELLSLLVSSGVSLTGMSTHAEFGVRVLSRVGRFDAVRFLLDAGANPVDVQYTKLIEAVAFGSTADMEEVIAQGADLEEQDYWERTAWLVAIQTGDIAKARLLLEQGAKVRATGRCGQPPLFYAIAGGHHSMLAWLLEMGIDIGQINEFGTTALAEAAECGNAEMVDLLLQAGAEVNQPAHAGSALSYACTRDVALRLLAAGADPQELTSDARRAILGYPPDPDENLLNTSAADFVKYRVRRFGAANPEVMNNPFWEGMIRSGLDAYQAAVHIQNERRFEAIFDPIWCAKRFGQSLTFLPDGRIVQIAGEHEDHYDPDFCIYNDVFVHHLDGSVTLYGYPEAVFPPTDFHTATLIGKHIYVIGSLGYQGTRIYGETPVYRLDTETLQMEAVKTTGDNPGWIYEHQAVLLGAHEIQISGGKV